MARDEDRVIKETQKVTEIDAEGNETTQITEVDKTIKKANPEPDYIKLYTDTWCEFNEIPPACRPLFLELAMRMSYADGTSPDGGQLVNTGKPYSTSIQDKLGIKKSRYLSLIAQLVECKALRKINRGVYQINPSYAGRGEWHYNPNRERGGIENIIAKFNFADKTVDTEFLWADDGEDTGFNKMYRRGLHAKRDEGTTMTSTIISGKPADGAESSDDNLPGQMSILDTDMRTGTGN